MGVVTAPNCLAVVERPDDNHGDFDDNEHDDDDDDDDEHDDEEWEKQRSSIKQNEGNVC